MARRSKERNGKGKALGTVSDSHSERGVLREEYGRSKMKIAQRLIAEQLARIEILRRRTT